MHKAVLTGRVYLLEFVSVTLDLLEITVLPSAAVTNIATALV